MSSRREPKAHTPHRAGVAAIVGRPKVGKSTVLNRLVGSRISITSSKPQTTRRRVTGIVTREDAQVLFVDTPGYQTEHRAALNVVMNRNVSGSLQGADAVVWLVEALKYDPRDDAVAGLLSQDMRIILAINKTDALRDKSQLLPFIQGLAGRRRFEAIIPISAAKGTQTDALLDAVVSLLPEGPPFHDADEITTVSERVLAAELLREQLFRQLGDEVPYALAVEIEQFRLEGGVRRIGAAILVDKEGQKPIVIGRQGSKLKSIASKARLEMERLFDGSVFLEVWVKVRRGWSDSASALRRLGYEE